MRLSEEVLGGEPVPDALRVSLVIARGAPPADLLSTGLARDAIDATVLDESAIADGPPATPLALVWLPADVTDAMLAALVAWRGGAAAPTLLLGCCPQGSADVSERALAAGFDDFVAGRSSPRELAARLRALSRRSRGPSPTSKGDALRWGRIAVDPARHELVVDGRRVPLTTLEVTVLSTLVAAQGRTLTREELLDLVWGEDNLEIGLRAVDNLILRLRRKIGDPDRIVTVRGVGFRLAEG
jgi:DNA-binding response OmpR family regulator